jgi:branched-chain amino acid aminotransferase
VKRVVWLDGRIVDAASAAIAVDDPAVRFGEGLFETMRAHDGRVALLDRHLSRLTASAEALAMARPDVAAIRDGVAEVAGRLGAGPARLRVTVTPGPTTIVEAEPVAIAPRARLAAITIPGAWHPERAVAEHKTLSYLECRLAQRRAAAAGAGVALLLDGAGRLGEAAIANVMCVAGGRILTPPVRGLLPGVARALVMELAPVTEVDLPSEAWRAAEEVFVTNALHGVRGIASVDGVRWSDHHPVTDELADRIEAILRGASP